MTLGALPVQEGAEAVRPDDEVAVADVAVDDGALGKFARKLAFQPAESEGKSGTRLQQLAEGVARPLEGQFSRIARPRMPVPRWIGAICAWSWTKS